jgi:hypothetical protein
LGTARNLRGAATKARAGEAHINKATSTSKNELGEISTSNKAAENRNNGQTHAMLVIQK